MTLRGWKLILNRVLFIPQRYVLGIMGLFALANSFTMRVCLSMTITQMVLHTPPSEHIIGETCPDVSVSDNSATSNTTMVYAGRERYDWSEATQGFLLSAFYYGYVLTHLPGGILAEKFGGKWTVGVGLLCTSLATILTPCAVGIGGATGLFIIRVIEGAGEGTVTPGFVLLLARWVPPSERSRFGAMIFGGAQIGNIFGPYISGHLLANGGDWANVFYVFGTLGILWFLFWIILCYNTPNTHPFISDDEREYLNANVTASGLHKKLNPVPFKAILRSAPLWVLILAAVGHDWGYFTMITDLPKYFSDVLKFNIKETGLMSALPYIAMYVCSFIFASICDLCIRKKWHSIGNGRKIYTTLSSSVPAVFIILASYSGCNRLEAVILFIASMAFMGGFYSSVKINAMDIAPNYAGTCSAFVNGIAAISGIITPYLVGLLTPDQTIEQWRIAFWTVFAVLVVTNIVYLIWGSGEQQWWDDVDKHGYPPNWKHGPFTKRVLDTEKKVVYPKHDHSPVTND
ncbi:putative inorganic phosphate cotransporter [Galleria mellonella]|uniref:Inorganic phosphate cotransporter n=1 Tax=Galleria mellonella TaxID=7137 RepID=A0A6J3C0L4_GALME|nr:putative inorganic phosphate cotransporter [Galleria mellonella]XP_052759326.1 putative inorganic phosphate cotransporter [Galleria mellonella]